MPIVRCPACGEDDRLEGMSSGERAHLVCESCGHRWERDLTPQCRRCGSRNLEAVPTSTLEEAGRGDMRTPSGIRDIHHCLDCGARDATSSKPVPPPPDWSPRGPALAAPRRPRSEVSDGPQDGATRTVNSVFGTFGVGHTIGGRWRIGRLLHRSSTGSLWLAEDGDGRRVTFKLVHPSLTKEGEAASLYVRAARPLVDLAHEHLLRLHDVRTRHGHVLVVAEAFPGTPLSQGAPIGGRDLARIASGLSSALAVMHRHRLAHLDIRPDKILLGPQGSAKLVDFGTGRLRAGTSVVPPAPDPTAWRAPEQIVGGRHGPPADVYSLGFVLWAAAGGELAVLGATSSDRARHRLRSDVPPLDGGVLPPGAAEAIAAATRGDPLQRPSAAELAAALGG